MKELAVLKAAEEEHPGSVTAQIVTRANEQENSVTLIDASKIYDDDKCEGEGVGENNYVLRIENNNTIILGKK